MANQSPEEDVSVLSSQVEKDIVVIMPFGSKNVITENRAILDLMRIKYLIENKIKIKPRGSNRDGEPIKYTVRPFRTMSGAIASNAAKAIAEADVVVALITEFNANVIYELAIRNLLKEEVVIICGDEVNKKNNLPVYTKDFATISYHHSEDENIIEAIKSFSEMNGAELHWDKIDQEYMPNILKNCIDKNDSKLQGELQNAMQNLENGKATRPEFLQELSKDLDPGKMLSNWTTYCPFSILRILWQRKSEINCYIPDDLVSEAVVVSAMNYTRGYLP